MKMNPVVHFEIYVQNMERAKAFYEAVLAVKLEPMQAPSEETVHMEMSSFPMDRDTGMTTYGSGGMLVKMEGIPGGGSGTVVYFACEDCAVQVARATEHGGRVFKSKTPIGHHGYFALVRDTEDNLIGFHSMS